MQRLVVVRLNVATGKHGLDVLEELRIDCHHIFEVTVDRTIFDHPDLSVAFNNLGFDLADLLIDEDGDILFSRENCFARFNDAVRTKRICRSWPTQSWFGLLP